MQGWGELLVPKDSALYTPVKCFLQHHYNLSVGTQEAFVLGIQSAQDLSYLRGKQHFPTRPFHCSVEVGCLVVKWHDVVSMCSNSCHCKFGGECHRGGWYLSILKSCRHVVCPWILSVSPLGSSFGVTEHLWMGSRLWVDGLAQEPPYSLLELTLGLVVVIHGLRRLEPSATFWVVVLSASGHFSDSLLPNPLWTFQLGDCDSLR